MASEELFRIRVEAFLRWFLKAAQTQSGTITLVLLSKELGLPLPQVRSLITLLVSDGLVQTKGEGDSEYVVFTEKGLTEANEVKNSGVTKKAKILCIDTEPEVVQQLSESGYVALSVDMGYRTGKREFTFPPPHEVELIVCDLKRPACFDMKDWGPGKSNNNFQCKIIPYDQVNNWFLISGNRRLGQHRVVQESQLGKLIPGTFGPKDVNRAIVQGGIPFLLFLNPEWINRAGEFPNWLDVDWSFLPTKATQVHLSEPLPTLIPELGAEIAFRFPIQHKIEKGPLFGDKLAKQLASVTSIVSNKIGDIFGQVVRMGEGAVWLLPSTHQNREIIQLFASRLEQAQKLSPPQEGAKSHVPLSYDAILKNLRAKHNLNPPQPVTNLSPQEGPMPSTKIDLFISHSSGDAAIALELINLLRSAIPGLHPDKIRCTSVEGYKLAGGAKTEEQLLKESLGAKVFIALLSDQSLQSTYVLFECGARWSADKLLIPLVTAGMTASQLKAPLSGLNALSTSVESQMYQLVGEVAAELGLEPAKPQIYEGQAKKLINTSEELARKRHASSVEVAKSIVK